MKRITISLETGNAAFDGGPGAEVARILQALAQRFADGAADDGDGLRDVNGNTVGTVKIKGKRS